MTMWAAIKATYSDGVAFAVACPLLALLPMCFEMLQHIVEVHIGMYDSIASAQNSDTNHIRLIFGFIKVIALYAPSYWIVRFVYYHDRVKALRIDVIAIRLFLRFLAFEVVLSAIQIVVLSRSGATLALAAFFADNIIMSLIAAWGAGAPLGNERIGPYFSCSIMGPRLIWTFAFFLMATLPLMIAHYAFAILAVLGPKVLLWPILSLDALLVSFLTIILAVSGFHAGSRAAKLAGVGLGRERMDQSRTEAIAEGM